MLDDSKMEAKFLDLNFTDISGRCHIKQDALRQLALGAISETREIKIHDHKESDDGIPWSQARKKSSRRQFLSHQSGCLWY